MNATPAQTARTVMVVVVIAAAIYLAYLLRDFLLLAVLAVFVAVALSGPVGFVERATRAPRALAILLVYLAIVGLIVLVGLVVVPPLVEEIEEFVRAVPGYIRDLRDNATLHRWDEEYGLVAKLEGEADKLPSLLGGAAAELETVTVGAAERAAEAIAIAAIAFLLLLDGPRIARWIRGRLTPERADQFDRLTSEAGRAIGGYVAGAFAAAGLAGLASFVAMVVLGIPFAIPLAVQMAFFALIPLVGSAIGAIVIALVALFEGPGIAIAFLVYFIVYQQLETHVLGPFVYKRTVQLRPIIVILSVFAGATLLGILGALLAIPAAATIQIVAQEVWRIRHPPADPAAPPAAPEPEPA